MTPQAFVQRGTAEPLKGSVHASAAGILGLMAVYNAAAFLIRHETRLGLLGLLYIGGCVFEVHKTLHHCGRPC